MDRNFILNSIRDLRGEDVANSLSEHAKDVSWVESEDRNIPQYGGGPARGLYQYEIKGTKDGSGASETALNRFYNYISTHNLSIPPEYEEELKNLSDKNNPDFTELSPELQSQIFYADKALGAIPLDKLADGSLSSRDAWVKYHWAGSEKDRPAKEKQFDRAMRTRPPTIKKGSDSVDAQTDKMLSEEQKAEEESGFLDTVGEYASDAYNTATEYVGDAVDTVGEYASDAYDTASEYVGETVDTLERVAESVGEKLRRLLGLEEEQQSSTQVDNPPIPERRPVTAPPVEDYGFVEPAPGSNLEDQGPAVLEKAEGGSVEKKAEFIKKDDDDDVPDPPPGATPEEVADDIPAYLSTGEYVLPANVVRYIGLKNITDMHQRALTELQQMEDLDIIENVDENGYVEEDDDEMDYMEPEGVVEIVVAEHPPKGLMAMGFAEGGLVEAMVYVPGVGFVPQTQATYLSGTKGKDKKTEEQEDTDKSILEGGESQGDTNDTSEGGPTGAGYGNFSEMVNDPSFQSQAKEVIGLFGTPLATDIVTGTIKGFQEQYGFDDPSEQIGSAMAGATDDPGTTGAPGMGDTTGSGVGSGVEGGLGTTGGHDDGGEDSDTSDSDTSESAAEAASEAADNLRDGGYVSKKGIMAKGYSQGGEAGDPGGGPGGPLEYEPELEEVEGEEPTDPYEGYTYVRGIGYVPTSRDTTTDKSVDSTSLALSSIFTPGFLKTIGLMSDPNKEL